MPSSEGSNIAGPLLGRLNPHRFFLTLCLFYGTHCFSTVGRVRLPACQLLGRLRSLTNQPSFPTPRVATTPLKSIFTKYSKRTVSTRGLSFKINICENRESGMGT